MSGFRENLDDLTKTANDLGRNEREQEIVTDLVVRAKRNGNPDVIAFVTEVLADLLAAGEKRNAAGHVAKIAESAP